MLIEIRIPHWIGFRQQSQILEPHGFADASLKAYGAVLYLRVFLESEVTMALLCFETKVSFSLSVPKLEMCEAVLSTKLTKKSLISSLLGNTKIHL